MENKNADMNKKMQAYLINIEFFELYHIHLLQKIKSKFLIRGQKNGLSLE